MSYPITITNLSKSKPIRGTIRSQENILVLNDLDSTIVDVTGSIYNNWTHNIQISLEIGDEGTSTYKRNIILKPTKYYQIQPNDTFSLGYQEYIKLTVISVDTDDEPIEWSPSLAGFIHYHFEKSIESGSPIIIDYGFEEIKQEVIEARLSYPTLNRRLSEAFSNHSIKLTELENKVNINITDIDELKSLVTQATSGISDIWAKLEDLQFNTWQDYQALFEEIVASRGTMDSLHQRLGVSLNDDGTLKRLPAEREGLPRNWTYNSLVELDNYNVWSPVVSMPVNRIIIQSMTIVNTGSEQALVKIGIFDSEDKLKAIIVNTDVHWLEEPGQETPHSLYFEYNLNLDETDVIKCLVDKPNLSIIISGLQYSV